MTQQTPSHASRRGFTAVELLVVIGIMMLLMGMAMPGVLNAMRRGTVNSAANDVAQCWRQARMMALTRCMPDAPAGTQPKHYGVMVVAKEGERSYVALIYDNRDSASIQADGPEKSVLRADPTSAATSDAVNPPLAKYALNRGIAVATAAASGTQPTIKTSLVLVAYAQYRTGVPIDPAEVASGHASTAAAIGVGLAGNPSLALPDSPVCAKLRLQTMDYEAAKRGYAVGVTLYPVGVVASSEL